MANDSEKDIEKYKRIAMDSKGEVREAWNKFIKNYQKVDNYQSNITITDRKINRLELKSLLNSNVCEIVFVRRRPERAPDRPLVRRMLCTNSGNILNSLNGKISLRYRPPKTSFRINEQLYNLCVVWDILWCDYRNVSMEDCYLRQIIPDDNTFWKYYNDVLYKMSPQQKLNFMDSYG